MDAPTPVMDDCAATRAIRFSAHADAESIPIIAMTGDAFAENVAQSPAAGMNDHVSKPVDFKIPFDSLRKSI